MQTSINSNLVLGSLLLAVFSIVYWLLYQNVINMPFSLLMLYITKFAFEMFWIIVISDFINRIILPNNLVVAILASIISYYLIGFILAAYVIIQSKTGVIIFHEFNVFDMILFWPYELSKLIKIF